MARIARRSLRLRAVPIFSLKEPWEKVANDEGRLGLRLYEPRYVELARRVLPPAGHGKFGYSEGFPPRRGGSGVLAEVLDFKWTTDGPTPADREGPVLVTARASRRFRILRARSEEVVQGQPPLYLAHVQLLEERDVLRKAQKAIEADSGLEEASLRLLERRSRAIKAGTTLIAKQDAPVFESAESWEAVGRVPTGVGVVAAGPPTIVEGYLMVPIIPSGAVELTLFRELLPSGEVTMPSEEELRAALGSISAEMTRRRSARDSGSARGRKSQGRDRG